MSSPIQDGASEFGGHPGRVQPAPHDIADSAYEQLNLSVRSNPSDPASNAASVAEEERELGRRRLRG